MIDRIIQRLADWHIGISQIIRWLAVAASASTAGLAAGSIVILGNPSNPANSLLVSKMYPPLFAVAAVAWLVVAFNPSPGWCSVAASAVAAPALIRSGDFALTWYQDGAERPGTQIVAISGWSLVAILAIAVGVLLPILDHRRPGG